MAESKYTFTREFHAQDAKKNLEIITNTIMEEIRHKKIQDVKVKVEISQSKISFKVDGK